MSLRTVYHHFGRLSELAAAALESGSSKRLRTLPDLAPQGSLGGRIEAFVQARGDLFEGASGLAQATVAVGQPSRSLESPRGSRSVLRRQVERTFESELAEQSSEAQPLLDAIDAVASADAWAYLRDELGRSTPEAQGVVGDVLTRLLRRPQDGRRRATSG